jgi:hypothetical protein
LARGADGWSGLGHQISDAISDPTTTWHVALVITSLSLSKFDEAAALPVATPHFIQLVSLLAAFTSGCRERDAQPVIYCRQ